MRKSFSALLGCVLAMPATFADARMSERDAKRECQSEAHDQYYADDIHSMIVNHRGGDDYIVTGIAEAGRSDKVTFVCTIKEGRVQSLTPPGRGSHAHGGGGDRPPEIFVGRNGEGEVVFANNCVVHYRADGSRDFSSRNCDRGQKRRADDAMAAYRREQGLDGQVADHSPPAGEQPPQIFAGSNGEAEVVFANNCVVYYRSNGRRDHASAACSRGQRNHADDAIARYRREQGLH